MATRRTQHKDYAAIADRHIFFPSQQEFLPKILIYAGNKKGKTTFVTSVGRNNVIVADPEHGTNRMKTKDPHVWSISNWADVDDFYEFCRAGLPCPRCKPVHHFTWASLDGMTRICNMALRHVMKMQEERSLDRIPGIVDRRDYFKSGELVKEMLTKFHNLNMGVIYTAQERQVEGGGFDDEGDEDIENAAAMFVPDLPKGARGMINSLVDVIGRLYVVRVDVKGTPKAQRRLWVGESTQTDTGYRSEYTLPNYIKYPTVPKLIRLMETGSVKQGS